MSDVTGRLPPTLTQAAQAADLTSEGLARVLRRMGYGLIKHGGRRFVDEGALKTICEARAALGFKPRGRKAKKELSIK